MTLRDELAALRDKLRLADEDWAATELDALIARLPPAETYFICKARKTADPPQDCNWPFCGCDPYADKVIAAIQEFGRLPELLAVLRAEN